MRENDHFSRVRCRRGRKKCNFYEKKKQNKLFTHKLGTIVGACQRTVLRALDGVFVRSVFRCSPLKIATERNGPDGSRRRDNGH